jgi:uncharacterized protein (TIRG00374 family)
MISTLVYFFVRLQQSGDLSKAFSSFGTAIIGFLILAFFLMLVSLFLKAYRFYILLKPSSPDLKFRKFLLPFFVGYGFSTLGPLKTGEIASVEINKRSLSIPRSNTLAAIAFFRILDLYVVIIFFIVALGTTIPRIVDPNYTLYLQIVFYVSLAGTIFLSFVFFFPPIGKFTLNIIQKIVGKFSERGEEWIEGILHPALLEYYASLKHLYTNKILALLVIVTTVVKWFFEFYSVKVTLIAFNSNITVIDAAAISSVTLLVGIVTFVPAGLGTGTLTTQALLEGLLIPPPIVGASIIYQTLIGTGLTLSVAAISSFFVKETKSTEKDDEDTVET